MPRPQSFVSEFAPRLRGHLNSLLTPVIPPSAAPAAPTSRTTKRGTVVINYSEDLLHDDDFEDSDGPRRLTGLRSRREPDINQSRDALVERMTRECVEPVEVQGIWRDWMGKPKFGKTDKQLHAQACLPLTMIPIRIDLDIPSFTPAAALPLPGDTHIYGVNPSLPAYKVSEPTPPYRLKDVFLWNLHETLITPESFALVLVNELDLPNANHYAVQIAGQIRQQLEEYAGVALHPLFHSTNTSGVDAAAAVPKLLALGISRDQSQTPALPSTPGQNGIASTNGNATPVKTSDSITAEAAPVSSEPGDINNPDDTYRCIITLNINLLNKLYTDRFEWSLLHPPGIAEHFAKQTCADLGLAGEWVPTMAHAIYEAVLRLKKEACESGGLVGAFGHGNELDNLAIEGQEAGWRYEPEQLAEEWEPKVEIMSKEDIEKREVDRERQIRRLRRETARFSSTANMAGGMPTPGGGHFDQPDPDTPMGRGERSKKKRRFRSLSPQGRGDTPGSGYYGSGSVGGGSGGPTEREKMEWRCSHCWAHGSTVWAIRDGPSGPRSLCNNCGLYFEREKQLPPNSKNLHLQPTRH